MHNRMWSSNNVYAKQNGGAYDFIIDEDTNLAIPTDQTLWDDLIANKTPAGLVTYEQDWMYNEFEGLNATLQKQGQWCHFISQSMSFYKSKHVSL